MKVRLLEGSDELTSSFEISFWIELIENPSHIDFPN